MSFWTVMAIMVVAGVLGETLKAYFKSKEKAAANDDQFKEKIRRYELEMEALRKRVRNLEVIAASSPGDFQGDPAADPDQFDFESEDEFNEKLINQLARKKTKG